MAPAASWSKQLQIENSCGFCTTTFNFLPLWERCSDWINQGFACWFGQHFKPSSGNEPFCRICNTGDSVWTSVGHSRITSNIFCNEQETASTSQDHNQVSFIFYLALYYQVFQLCIQKSHGVLLLSRDIHLQCTLRH